MATRRTSMHSNRRQALEGPSSRFSCRGNFVRCPDLEE
jgi:hypothetical protein